MASRAPAALHWSQTAHLHQPTSQPADADRLRNCAHHLALILPDGLTPGKIMVKTIRPYRVTFHDRAADAAAEARREDDAGRDVFYGVGRRVDVNREQQEGHVLALAAAWCDLDPDTGADVEAWRTAALTRLAAFTPLPSLVVRSGRGLHAYWLLAEPAGPEHVRAINTTLARRLGGDLKSCDPPRILRPVGTHHRKAAPVLVAFAPGWGTPGDAKPPTRYNADQLPHDQPEPVTVALPVPAWAAAILKADSSARWHERDRKITLRCPVHQPDDNPSAAVFANDGERRGPWAWCSACKISEPLRTWTTRPEVIGRYGVLDVPTRQKRARSLLDQSLPSGVYAVPRTTRKGIVPAIAAEHIAGVLRRGQEPSLLDRQARRAVYDGTEHVARALAACGTKGVTWTRAPGLDQPATAYRVLYALVAAWYECRREGRRPGNRDLLVTLYRKRKPWPCLAELLGYTLDNKGWCSGRRTRAELLRSVDALAAIKVPIRWSPTIQPFNGPILAYWQAVGLPEGVLLVSLHPGIVGQLSGGPAWTPARLDVLKAPAPYIGLHNEAAARVWEAQSKGRYPPPSYPLQSLAASSGFWNLPRARHDPGRCMDEWGRLINDPDRSGLGLHYTPGTAVNGYGRVDMDHAWLEATSVGLATCTVLRLAAPTP